MNVNNFSNNKLKNDFLILNQKVYNNINFNYNNYYQILDNENNLNFIVEYISHPILWKKLNKNKYKKLFSKLEFFDRSLNYDYLVFSYLKNKDYIFRAYILISFLRIFSQSNLKQQNEEDLLNSETFYLVRGDDLINLMIEQMENFFIYIEIKSDISSLQLVDLKILRDFLIRFFIECTFLDILEERKSKFINGKSFTLYKFKQFKIECPDFIFLSTEPFKIKELWNNYFYAYSSHFSAIFLCDRPNRRSGESFKTYKEFHEKLNNRFIYLDKNRLKIIFETLLTHHNIQSINLEKNYYIFKTKLIEELYMENKTMASELHRKISIYLNLIKLKTLLNLNIDNTKFFLPHTTCFRGRIYQLTEISYTFYIEFRYAMYFGYNLVNKNFLKHDLETNFDNFFNEAFLQLNVFNWFENLENLDKKTIVWIFISIGFMRKESLGKKVHFSNFISKGVYMFLNSSEEIWDDVYEKIEFEYYIFLISEVRNNSSKIWSFHKDVTASVFQLLIKILGHASNDSLEICNLRSFSYWYDTYAFIIDDFYENIKPQLILINKDIFFKYFNRKTLKKVMMTESYGAGLDTCFKYYKSKIKLNEEDLFLEKEIHNTFCRFYYSLKKNSLLLDQNAVSIINFFNEGDSENQISFSEKGKNKKRFIQKDATIKFISQVFPETVNLNYKKVINKRFEIMMDGKRHVKVEMVLTSDWDNRQFKTSIRPNYVHSQDSALARWYILETGWFSIHDSFLCDYRQITYSVCKINEGMNINFHDLGLNKKHKLKYFSVFIAI